MALFHYDARFAAGAWTHGVSWLLAPKRLVAGWHPRIRTRSAGQDRWIDYEPLDWSGSFFARGKPALRVVPASAEAPESLLVGYCVERDLAPPRVSPDHAVDSVEMNSHWEAFERCLGEQAGRRNLDALMREYPPRRAYAWIFSDRAECTHLYLPYEGCATLHAVRAAMPLALPAAQLQGVMLASRFTAEECAALMPKDVLREFGPAITNAARIGDLISGIGAPFAEPGRGSQ